MTLFERACEILKSAVYLSKKNAALISDDEERIKVSVLYPDWEAGKHEAGEIYNADGQTWECFQSYDNTVYPDITPDNSAWFTFNRPLHGKSPETARPFVKPMGAHDMYKSGEFMIWTDGAVYECVADTVYTPEEYAPAWLLC